MALTVTEKWILDKIKLNHDNLDDVKSLSLPGSYQDKIVFLGNSLNGFTRLKHLDLSKNNITSLQGLDQLKLLETLNLYYNSISSLKELFKLHHNKALKELDVRLNPVTKNEPDYRLFLIHMLPKLKHLDDRSVRDSERRAALSHFDTDQATQFEEDESAKHSMQSNKQNKKSQPSRVDLVKSLQSRPTKLDDDDMAILKLIHQNETHVKGATKPNKTHQQQNTQLAEVYSREEINDLDLESSSPKQSQRHFAAMADERPNYEKLDVNKHSSPTTGDQTTVTNAAYSTYEGYGAFTPNPRLTDNENNYQNLSHETGIRQTSSPKGDVNNQQHLHSKSNKDSLSSDFEPIVLELMTLVDKYWNGTKSLHSNRKFLARASQLLANNLNVIGQPRTHDNNSHFKDVLDRKSEQLAQAHQRCESLNHDNDLLRKRLMHEEEIKSTIKAANSDLTSLRDRIQNLQDENRDLMKNASQSKSIYESKISSLQNELGSSKSKIEIVELQNIELRRQAEQQTASSMQLSELTTMLQESHRSLVVTNDHLLQELDEGRQRHEEEIRQMKWSYDQLKNTADWLPTKPRYTSSNT